MKKTVAIFPGSFDPMTIGHVKVIEDSLKIFHTIIIAIGIKNNISLLPFIRTSSKAGLTSHACKPVAAADITIINKAKKIFNLCSNK